MSAVGIREVETFILDVPTVRAHVLSMATMKSQSMVIVRVYCTDDVVGMGEGTTIGGLSYGEESPEGIKLTIDRYLAPALLESDPRAIAATMRLLDRVAVGNHFAKSAVEIALLDAAGQRLGLPVSELLGGRVHDRLPVLWVLASGDTARDVDEAAQMIDRRRHNTFKLKIGKRPLEKDVEHVAAIKKAVGDRASIRVDVNQAWDEATARRGLAMLADVGVDLIEQPVHRADRAAMARLTARGIVPIMADEALKGARDAYQFARDGAADVFSVKLAQSGGPRGAKAVTTVAEAAGVGAYGGTMLEGTIGTAAALHVFATVPHLAFGTEQLGPLLLREEVSQNPLDYADFTVGVPTAPGLGVALDDAAVARFRRR